MIHIQVISVEKKSCLIVKYYKVLVYLLNTDLALFHMHAKIVSASSTLKKKSIVTTSLKHYFKY